MKYQSVLLAVRDMEKSKAFYCGLLGLEISHDFGANITLSNQISLQTLETWRDFIHTEDITFGHRAGELYFEEEDFDAFLQHLECIPGISYVHPMKQHRWGQRVVRIYDPDQNIVEIGETMGAVVRRFLASGMTVEETAKRMDVPVSFVRTHQTAL